MLTYTMSDDGRRGRIGPCVGGGVRMSIIGICKREGWEIPPATLDEATDLDSLKDINLDLQFRRAQVRRAESAAESARRRIDEAARQRRLPPAVAARVADLRRRAESIRTSAGYADRLSDLQRELDQAARLDQEAYQLAAALLEDQAA